MGAEMSTTPVSGRWVGGGFFRAVSAEWGGRSLPVFRLSSLVLNKTPPPGEIDTCADFTYAFLLCNGKVNASLIVNTVHGNMIGESIIFMVVHKT